MKVVLFCGGLGMRLRDYSDKIPKPMVEVGHRPILWHVMKYYAHFGHKDFILCLGYRSETIKNYFINYEEFLSNDFVLSDGGRKVSLLRTDIHDWKISFVDTGYDSSIGERLRRVRRHLEGEEIFLANYSDNVTDFYLPTLIDDVRGSDAVAAFLAIPPPYSFHVADIQGDGSVSSIRDTASADMWINGGYFVLRQEIFDYLRPGEELVVEAFSRLIAEQRLIATKHTGFWQNMDTFKDKAQLDELHAKGRAPWQVWNVEAEESP